jgi:hypothetical protein
MPVVEPLSFGSRAHCAPTAPGWRLEEEGLQKKYNF